MNREEHHGTKLLHEVKCELAREVLRSSGDLRFSATGWSMLPSIRPGETLVVKRVRSEQVRIGDVILTGRDSWLRAHRVVSIVGNGDRRQWITQGDALSTPDPPVNQTELLGRVVYSIRDGKCTPILSELSVIQSVLATIVRSSVPAARALVYLNRRRQVKASS
jgi:signal peptidase I